MRRLHVGGIIVGYRQFGSGPPLLLVIGQSSTMNEWGSALPRLLSRHFRVTMFDNRGVGYTTDQPQLPLTIGLMADDTARLLHTLGISSATVLGWSTGGEIGLALAERHPKSVRALILSGATAGGATAVQPAAKVQALLSSDNPIDELKLLGYLFPASAHQAEAAYLQDILSLPPEPISRQTLRRQAAAEERFARTSDTYDALPRISIPVLVTNGGLDQLVPPRNAKIIAGRAPHARLRIFPDAAHAMIFQDLDQFAKLVLTYRQRA